MKERAAVWFIAMGNIALERQRLRNARTTLVIPQRARDYSRPAALLLFVFILVICVTPRLRAGGDSVDRVDIRFQDILLIPTMIYLLLSKRPAVKSPMLSLARFWLPLFIWGATAVTALSGIVMPDVSIIRRISFLGRVLELFVLAAVVAALYLRAGRIAQKAALRAIHVGAFANITWVGYQSATGKTGTLLGPGVGDLIESYGPKLIGEGSAFGTGQYFAFIAAVAVAEYRTKATSRAWALVLFASAFAGAELSQSRISVGAILLLGGILMVISTSRNRLINVGGVAVGVVTSVFAVVFILPQLQGRQSVIGVESSASFRTGHIWGVLIDLILANPLTGIGPAGLTGGLPTEAHDIYLRAALDFGIIFGMLFLGIFIVVACQAFKMSRTPGATVELKLFSNVAFLEVAVVLFSGIVQDALTGVTSSHLAMVGMGLFAAVAAKAGSTPLTVVGESTIRGVKKALPR